MDINGNVSYTIVGAVNKVKNMGYKVFTFTSLKKDTSSNIFKIIASEKKIRDTKKKLPKIHLQLRKLTVWLIK